MAKLAPIGTDIYTDRRRAQQAASRISRDPDYRRRAVVVKRTVFSLAWGTQKRKLKDTRKEATRRG